MSRRKDNKGRVLRTGESQRKDLIYQYRYTDALGNRKCIYASDLKTLREKEDELQRSLEDGLDYAGGEITVYELLQRYLSLKCGVRCNTKVGYASCVPAYFLYQYGKCGDGYQGVAVCDGALRCKHHAECLHPRKL